MAADGVRKVVSVVEDVSVALAGGGRPHARLGAFGSDLQT